LDRDSAADRAKRKLAGDIGWIRTREGWIYLAVIEHLHASRMTGRAVGKSGRDSSEVRQLRVVGPVSLPVVKIGSEA
jgi:hypothetical protein